MPAEVNGNHAIAHFNRARVIMYSSNDYFVCGTVVITPHFVFLSGHGNETTGFEPVVGIAVPRPDIRLIVDHSVETCETHDKMDAEAKARADDAEENKKD